MSSPVTHQPMAFVVIVPADKPTLARGRGHAVVRVRHPH